MHKNEQIQSELIELNSILARIPLINVYKVPESYFDNNSIVMIEKTKNKIQLEGDSKKNTYNVPNGYFDSLPNVILNKVTTQANIMPMRTRKHYFNFAVAASMAGMIGLGIFFIVNNREQKSDNLASIVKEANTILKSGNFEKELENLSDDDIVNYLKLNGSDVNAALVASITDENKLPNEADYLYDDHALDNFLKETNIKKINSIRN